MPTTIEPRPSRPVTAGHAVFAATIIALAVLAFVRGDFTPPWTGVPADLPGRALLVYLTATISLTSGVGLLSPSGASLASRALVSLLLVWLLVFRISHILVAPAATDTWWGCADGAAMVAAAWVLYIRVAPAPHAHVPGLPTGHAGLRLAHVLYGLALVPFGIAHFTYLQRTVEMVPAWLPGHLVWACVTGTAFLVAAMAILSGVLAPLAAALVALQIGSFTLIVWIPVVAAGPDASQWAEFVTSWALTAAAWVVADSYRATWRLSESMNSPSGNTNQDPHLPPN